MSLHCECCFQRPSQFWPLDPGYIRTAVEKGFDHPFDEWEMLNCEAYGCDLCGASDRERFIAYFVRRNPWLVAGHRVLDFAPSAALTGLVKSLSPETYTTIDRFRSDVDLNDDISDLKSVASGSVDLLVCSHVLEHVPNDRKALMELRRILSEYGVGILVVPISLHFSEIQEDPEVKTPDERWRRFGQDDHVRIYNRDGFLSRIAQAGLSCHEFRISRVRRFAVCRKYGISPTSCLYVVYKSERVGAKLRWSSMKSRIVG